MPRIDYSKTVIYKISCKNNSVNFVHIGSTTNFSKKKFDHKTCSISDSKLPLYVNIRENGGWDNWKMEVLEKYPCDNKNDVIEREQYWIKQLKPSSNHICEKCEKGFSRKDSLMRHTKICKKKSKEIEKTEEIEELKKRIADQQTQIDQLNSKTLNIKNTNNIINNNNTNNITYRLELGNENLHERLTALEKKSILDKMHSSLIEYIKLVHFSGKFPDCMNFFCTNLRSNYAQVYNEDQKQFITQFATDFFNNVIDTRLDEINTMFDEHKDKLETIKIERLNKFFESMESTSKNKSKRYMETIADVKMLAYNNKHKFDSHPSIVTIQDVI